jgi:flagellar hook-basal body complex protein FliE
MDISAISAIAGAGGLEKGARLELINSSLAPFSPGAAGASGFAEALGKALSSANEAQQRAETMARQFQLNDPNVTLEETMIAMQTANISFQSLVQVRNRLLSAYHEIMNLQV